MSGINLAALETVHKASVRGKILQNHTEVRLIEHIHYLVDALVNGLLDEGRVIDDVLDLESHVADNHRESEILHRTGSRIGLEPLSLRVSPPGKDAVEGRLCDFSIFRTAGSLRKLRESHAGQGVGENIVRLDQRLSLPCQ